MFSQASIILSTRDVSARHKHLSFCPQGGVWLTPPWADTHKHTPHWAYTPLGRHPSLGRHPPTRQTHPDTHPRQIPAGRHPSGQTPQRQTPPWADTPPRADGYCSGRYVSYWDEFFCCHISIFKKYLLRINSRQHSSCFSDLRTLWNGINNVYHNLI